MDWLWRDFVAAMRGVEVVVIGYPPDSPMTYAGHQDHVRERLPKDGRYVPAECAVVVGSFLAALTRA